MKCEFCDTIIRVIPDNGICPNCGGTLRRYGNWMVQSQTIDDRKSGEWKEGMRCPSCGGTEVENKKCVYCGTQLIVEKVRSKNTLKGATSIPTSGGYLGAASSLVLSDSGLSICVEQLFKKYRTKISYEDLRRVVYVRPTKKSGASGILAIRGKENEKDPISLTPFSKGEKSAIALSRENDMLFYHIYHMLKCVAPADARFEMVVAESDTSEFDAFTKEIDMNYFFDMYAPNRERAASAICAKHETNNQIAREMVDRYFDVRQKKQYEIDPLDAMRDLNLVVQDMRRQQQKKNRDDAERRKRLERERIISAIERLER